MKDPARYHAMLPVLVHDERARQDFVSTLRRHLTGRIVPGNAKVYEARVAPQLRRELGREPADRHEVRHAMERDPYYQFWSAMQRRSQEQLWESVVDPTERDAAAMQARAREFASRLSRGKVTSRGSLTLDPTLTVPRYHTAVDIHLQPGGYHTDFGADDLSAGALYDRGIQIYSAGSTGPLNDAMGRMMVQFYREHVPGAAPQRILDMGCAIGNSTLPWATAFTSARIDAIDVAAPQLRYGHARAQSMGVAVHFSQQNAERTIFPDACFDVVVSHIMLHETSRSALNNILSECHRVLRPGGWMLHLEIPRGKTVLEQFQMNWESYNNNETFGSFMTDIDLTERAVAAGFQPERTRSVDYALHRPQEQRLYSDYFLWRILVAQR